MRGYGALDLSRCRLWRIARPPYKKAFPGEIACGERDDWLVPGTNKTDLEALCGGRVSSTGSGVGQSAGASGCNLRGKDLERYEPLKNRRRRHHNRGSGWLCPGAPVFPIRKQSVSGSKTFSSRGRNNMRNPVLTELFKTEERIRILRYVAGQSQVTTTAVAGRPGPQNLLSHATCACLSKAVSVRNTAGHTPGLRTPEVWQ